MLHCYLNVAERLRQVPHLLAIFNLLETSKEKLLILTTAKSDSNTTTNEPEPHKETLEITRYASNTGDMGRREGTHVYQTLNNNVTPETIPDASTLDINDINWTITPPLTSDIGHTQQPKQ